MMRVIGRCLVALAFLAVWPNIVSAQEEAMIEALQVYIPYTQFRLDNGLNVIVHRDRFVVRRDGPCQAGGSPRRSGAGGA